MKILELGKIDELHLHAVGGKARGLDRLIREGFRVPRGFVIVGAEQDSDSDLLAATEYYVQSGLRKVAVRSSATAEDGTEFSYAGQFETCLNVEGETNFREALLKCLQSLESGTGKEYTEQFGSASAGMMSVVVQEMVDAEAAGVCFSADPANSKQLLVEAVEGLGDALVSGEVTAVRYPIPHSVLDGAGQNGTDLTFFCQGDPLLTPDILGQIARGVMRMQTVFGTPLDTEWAMQGNVLYWLQARPITVLETCEETEFDSKEDISGHIVTRCNIGEMLPEAVTPLSLSVSLYAIDWGLREMLRIAGAIKKVDDLPPYACALSSRGHLFMDLTSLYRLEKAAFLANKDNVDFSICGRILENPSVIPGKKAWFFKRLNNTRKYLGFILSRNKARKKLAEIADTFAVGTDETTSGGLYRAIDAAKNTADRTACLHYITSAHSGAMSSAAIQIMDKQFKDTDKCKAVLAELLGGIDGIESVDILASLRRVGRAVLEDNPKASNYSAAELTAYLNTAGESVQQARTEFLTRHGHRAIREAELRSKGWADDDAAFAEFLKTVIAGGTADAEPNLPPDVKAILTGYGFKGLKRNILAYLCNQAREGVKNREYSKSKLIKVLDAFKKAYARLSRMLTEEKKLPDEDAIFFLTHEEIGSLIQNENPGLIKKALQRRRLLKPQSDLRFDEVSIGLPEPLPAPDLTDAGDVLKGTSISRGSATGPARIVRCAEDAANLQKGEIMVAVYTDIGWSPFYCLIDGLVTEIGSALSHGAVVAREYALPLVSNVAGATLLIQTGDIITVDGTSGSVTRHEGKR